MARIMLTIDDRIYKELKKIAQGRGVKVATLIRAVIIPEWLETEKSKTRSPSKTKKGL